ncbi:MAG: hypothetical protein WCA36_16415, partial [Pseudolabrys sp.]
PILGAGAGLGAALSLALSFVTIRRHTRLPIVPAVGAGALLAGLIGLARIGPQAMGGGHLWAIALAGGVILPVSFLALSLASRYTQASNVSLLMLLETILGPLWVWAGTGVAPTRAMLGGGAVVMVSIVLYLWYIGRRQARARKQMPEPGELAGPLA